MEGTLLFFQILVNRENVLFTNTLAYFVQNVSDKDERSYDIGNCFFNIVAFRISDVIFVAKVS